MAELDLHGLPSPDGVFELSQVLGTGTYGEVYKARHIKTNETVAVKCLELVEDEEEEIRVEIEVLQRSSHPNIPKFYGAFIVSPSDPRDNERLWIAMELCTAGSITDLGKNLLPKHLPEEVIAYVLRETLAALVYLHNNDIIHRDIKGQNIMLNTDGGVKVLDFGVSCTGRGERNTFIGTPYWMAPEVIACDQQLDALYDNRCDSWAVGITAIEMADTEPPLHDVHPMRALYLIPRNPPPTVEAPEQWSAGFKAFIQGCVVKDYYERPTATTLAQHPFMKQVPATARPALMKLVKQSKTETGKSRRVVDEDDGEVVLASDSASLKSGVSDGFQLGVVVEDSDDDGPDYEKPVKRAKSMRTRTRGRKKKIGIEGLVADSNNVAGFADVDVEAGGGASAEQRASRKRSVGFHETPEVRTVEAQRGGGGSEETFLDRIMPKDQREALPNATMAMRKKKQKNTAEGAVKPSGGASAAVIPGFGPMPALPTQDQLTEDVTMPKIRKFKKKFPSEVLAASFWGQNMIVGARNGLTLLDRTGDGKVFPLIKSQRFRQVEVLESLGVMITICGKREQLRAYNLAYFKGQVLRKVKANQELYSTIHNKNHCTHFHIARYDRLRFLCVAAGHVVAIYLWAPRPYSKFMLFKEFEVPHRPLKVNLKVDEDESLKLIYASSEGFHSIAVDSGNVLNLHIPRPMPKHGICPHAVFQVPSDDTDKGDSSAEYLLCYDEACISVDEYGDVMSDVALKWADKPTSLAYAHPAQMFGWGSRAIEIRSVRDGKLVGYFKHHKSSRLRFLCTRENKVFFASVKGSQLSQIYFLCFS